MEGASNITEAGGAIMESLSQHAQAYGVRLTPRQTEQLAQYATMIAEWSPRVNLVGDASLEVIERRHFLESIALGAALREREVLRPDSRVLDVGAGAGFPGIVFAICWPGIALTLLEATAKKTAFLAAAVAALGIEATVLTGRAEDLAHDPSLRESFDLVVARAVAPLPTLLELTLPYARVGGRVVTPKGSRASDELAAATNALSVLGARVLSVPFAVPGPAQTLVVALKQRPTPALYPRRAGAPKRSPL